MNDRVPPSQRTGQKIRQLIAEGDEEATSRFVRLATQQVIEELVRQLLFHDSILHSVCRPRMFLSRPLSR